MCALWSVILLVLGFFSHPFPYLIYLSRVHLFGGVIERTLNSGVLSVCLAAFTRRLHVIQRLNRTSPVQYVDRETLLSKVNRCKLSFHIHVQVNMLGRGEGHVCSEINCCYNSECWPE